MTIWPLTVNASHTFVLPVSHSETDSETDSF